MTEPLTDLLADWTAVKLIGVVVGIIGLVLAVYKGWPIISQFVKTVDSLRELPVFIAQTQATLASQSQTLAVIHHEVLPNNGGSLADAAARTERNMQELTREVAHVKRQQGSMKTTLAKHTRALTAQARTQNERSDGASGDAGPGPSGKDTP